MIALIRDTVATLKASGVAILLVEQRIDTALAIADRIAFVSGGTVRETLAAGGLTADAPAFRTWVGL